MGVLGVLIFALGLWCVTYVKTEQVIVYSGMINHYDIYEVKTQPYFVLGIVMISIGACLSLVCLFTYEPNKSEEVNSNDKTLEQVIEERHPRKPKRQN